MTLSVFDRAAKSVLSRLGEDALLRSAPTAHKVDIDRDMQVYDREGNVRVAEYVATIHREDAPEPGNTLVVGADSFVLETRLDDDGYVQRFILRKV